ncbi:MAG: Gfo/Idh/MocA family protein [Thermomicrobiales bacterium]
MTRLRVGVIGAGRRSTHYIRTIPAELRPHVQVVAIADPDEANRASFAGLLNGHVPRQYAAGKELLETEELDALIIGSPNHVHVDDMLLALPRRIPILFEKPVAITLDECRQLWQAYLDAGQPPVTVGFVLRYSPFYATAKQLLDEGALGQVLTIDADEIIGTPLTGVFFRGWRRWDRLTGSFIVTKCCHDFDILNWLTGAHAEQVFSLARRTHFTPRPSGERHARFEGSAEMDFGQARDNVKFAEGEEGSPYDSTSEVPDHQTVTIAFDNGIISSFTACLAQPRTTRRLRVYGSDGALTGDVRDWRLRIEKPTADPASVDANEITLPATDGSHYGADPIIGRAFWGGALGESTTIRAGIREGIEAVLVGIAARESARSGLPVDVRRLRHEVFGEDLTDV